MPTWVADGEEKATAVVDGVERKVVVSYDAGRVQVTVDGYRLMHAKQFKVFRDLVLDAEKKHPDWRLLAESHCEGCRLKVWKKATLPQADESDAKPRKQVVQIRSSLTLKCSPEEAFDVLCDREYRKTWDPLMLEERRVLSLSNNNEVYYYAARMPAPLDPRDFVVQRAWAELPGGRFIIINHSVHHHEVPPVPTCVRGVSYGTGYYIARNTDASGECTILQLSHVDLKPKTPHASAAMHEHLGQSALDYLMKLKTAIAEYPNKRVANPPWRSVVVQLKDFDCILKEMAGEEKLKRELIRCDWSAEISTVIEEHYPPGRPKPQVSMKEGNRDAECLSNGSPGLTEPSSTSGSYSSATYALPFDSPSMQGMLRHKPATPTHMCPNAFGSFNHGSPSPGGSSSQTSSSGFFGAGAGVAMAKECKRCLHPFHITRRPHACRRCGDVFCSACSQGRAVLGGDTDGVQKPVRVCDSCSREISGKQNRGSLHMAQRTVSPRPQQQPGQQPHGQQQQQQQQQLAEELAEARERVKELEKQLEKMRDLRALYMDHRLVGKKATALEYERAVERRELFLQGKHHSKSCAICEQAFKFFLREHHCRSCYRSVCAPCSQNRLEQLRVCDWCDMTPPTKMPGCAVGHTAAMRAAEFLQAAELLWKSSEMECPPTPTASSWIAESEAGGSPTAMPAPAPPFARETETSSVRDRSASTYSTSFPPRARTSSNYSSRSKTPVA